MNIEDYKNFIKKSKNFFYSERVEELVNLETFKDIEDFLTKRIKEVLEKENLLPEKAKISLGEGFYTIAKTKDKNKMLLSYYFLVKKRKCIFGGISDVIVVLGKQTYQFNSWIEYVIIRQIDFCDVFNEEYLYFNSLANLSLLAKSVI